MTHVSICIASHRPEGLARLLESIARLKRPDGVGLEVVVVENAASRSALLDAALAADALGAPLRAFLEPRRNLAEVRNRSLEQARGDWIAFVDDDEVVHEDWLLAYWRTLESHEVDGCFGPVLPVFASDAAHESGAHPLRRKRFATGTPVSTDGMRAGNAFLRRALFAEHRFDPAYARIGEDWELFRRMVRSGARFVWCDEARVDEYVPAERLRLAWLSRRAFLGGATFARAESRGTAIPAHALLRWSAAALAGGLAAPIAALLGRSLGTRVWLRACVQAGKLVGALRAPKPAPRP